MGGGNYSAPAEGLYENWKADYGVPGGSLVWGGDEGRKKWIERSANFIMDPGGLLGGKGGAPSTFGQEAIAPYQAYGLQAGQSLMGPGGMLPTQAADISGRINYLQPQLREGGASMRQQADAFSRRMVPAYGEALESYRPYARELVKGEFDPGALTEKEDAQKTALFSDVRGSLAARGLGAGAGEGIAAEATGLGQLQFMADQEQFARQQAALQTASGVETGLLGAESGARTTSQQMLDQALKSQLGFEGGMAALGELPIANYMKTYGMGLEGAKALAGAEAAETAAKLQGKGGKGAGMGSLGGGLLAAFA